jgi:hypothetical protein
VLTAKSRGLVRSSFRTGSGNLASAAGFVNRCKPASAAPMGDVYCLVLP